MKQMIKVYTILIEITGKAFRFDKKFVELQT